MKHLLPFFTCVLLLLLSACGPSNNVTLLPPPPPDTAVIPTPNAPRVTVVTFEDNRQDQSVIGVRRDRSAFVTSDNVSQWISKGLADELSRQGLQISYALGVDEARKGNPDFLITGKIEEATLTETSATEMSASLRVSYALANRQKRLLRESPSAAQSRTGLFSSSAADNLMQETLLGLVKPMTQKIVQTVVPGKRN
ncbi:MAG: hypothetical protein J5861_02730 [Desulfovibrio sp.]|nr:hypothetical protein [Desulfovibrio sp.]